MKGSVTKYAIKGSSRPRWRYRVDACGDASGRRIQAGAGGFMKERRRSPWGEGRAHRTDQGGHRGASRDASAGSRGEDRKPVGYVNGSKGMLVHTCQAKTLERYRSPRRLKLVQKRRPT